MELPSSNNEKFLIFFQKKAFLIFWETKIPKRFLIFQEMEISLFQEIQTLKSFLYSGSNFPRSKNEKNTLKMF